MTPALIDTHAHIQGEEFAGDVAEVVARAREAGVEYIVVPGVDHKTSVAAINKVALAHEGVYTAAGFHPHEARHLDGGASSAIESMLQHPKIVAVGEIGLDYYYEHSPRDAQRECLQEMLRLAEKKRMPIIVHCRDAWADAAEVLAPWARRVRAAFEDRPVGVMHYFSGSLEQARFYIDLGFVISIHTSVTHKKQSDLRETVAQLPLDALVIETDSPYGAPQAYRGTRNEPAYAVEAAKQIAELHNASLDVVAEATSSNASRLFNLPLAVAPGGGRGR